MRKTSFEQRRRQLLGLIGAIPLGVSARPGLMTPAQTEGPFYPVQEQRDKDLDLTQIRGSKRKAQGRVIQIQGAVLSSQGAVLQDAVVEIWQANTWGRYHHPRDPNVRARLDPHFQGWGEVLTGPKGEFRFKTIYPGIYPAGPGWLRPPHIHFKVRKSGFANLTTQMYFPAEKLNRSDFILQNIAKDQQHMLIAKAGEDADTFLFSIILASS
ncbi:MAG: protocatechuate 3,4-dioxygenase [Gammaproteobacteria bacterium]|nr:protocatechuate 3,4-dioxygenase [Gammaproteobacteria bacterium]MDH5801375.1 protocatechuate 3,4-dioxygenase [Gammaproteobacteria bacterium]